jgi:hypothetical protein
MIFEINGISAVVSFPSLIDLNAVLLQTSKTIIGYAG